jgi:hypothetical protein
MSDKKVLSINPDLFSFSNTTKKRRKTDKVESDRIKIKQNTVVKNRDTLRKKSILKMIRNHQSERNKERFTDYDKYNTPATSSTSANNDFENAKTFFDTMVIDTNKNSYNNYTIKNHANHNTNDNINIDTMDIRDVSQLNNNPTTTSELSLKSRELVSIPKYGCLKNGNLPTYRNYMNQTRKNITHETDNEPDVLPENNNMYAGSSNITQKASILQQSNEKLKNLKKKKRQYRKKTITRTFKLGRSPIKPVISVLITNKTIRNKITETKQFLNQTTIPEIRSYLIKNGFIKIGSITPNDVLRKIYESAVLICGEVKNHNPDTLMYNFLNSKEEL